MQSNHVREHINFGADIVCPDLLGLANGAITFQFPDLATTPIFGTEAFHSCNDGYYLQGTAVISCVDDGATSVGVWDRSQPCCIGRHTVMHVRIRDAIEQYNYGIKNIVH